MSTTSQLSGRTSKPRKARGKLVLHATGSGAAQGFRLRPLQVTWEMTRVCRWRAAFTRSKKDAPREVNHLSTAEAFHLIEDVAAMQVPLLVTQGRADSVVLPAMAEHVLATCPTAEASWYDGTGHVPHLEDPRRFNRELAELTRHAHS